MNEMSNANVENCNTCFVSVNDLDEGYYWVNIMYHSHIVINVPQVVYYHEDSHKIQTMNGEMWNANGDEWNGSDFVKANEPSFKH